MTCKPKTSPLIIKDKEENGNWIYSILYGSVRIKKSKNKQVLQNYCNIINEIGMTFEEALNYCK